MTPSVVVDGRALQPGFKSHHQRGIGRYARNLLQAMLELEPDLIAGMLVREDLPAPALPRPLPLIPCATSTLPGGERLLATHWLARRALAPAWRQGRVVHLLSHLDAPALVGPRTVITVHDLIFQRMAKLYSQGRSRLLFMLARWLETRCLGRAALLIAPSRRTARDLGRLYGIAAERIRVIPEAPDPGLQPEKDQTRAWEVAGRHGLSDPFFLYLGGLDQRKDLPTLLAALVRLGQSHPGCTLALAGDPSQETGHAALLELVRQLGLTQRVRWLGFVPDADLPGLFAACRAFVFPSLYEGFGLPPLEAMACGAPVVAAVCGAVSEVVADAGILVPPQDPVALAKALAGLLDDPGRARRLAGAGIRRAAQYSWQQAARSTLEVYREAAHG